MEKMKINYIIDAIMFISIILVTISGAIMHILRHQDNESAVFTFIHILLGSLLTVLAIIHVILHWNWIVSMTKKIWSKKKK